VSVVTATVKDELSQLPAGRGCCRRAELSALLRFAGGLHLVAGRVVIEAELDRGLAARRLRREIGELCGQPARVRTLPAGGGHGSPRYLVWVERDGAMLARCTGLIDRTGRPVRGLPPVVVSGGRCDAAAAWRGAFLANGSLSECRGSSALQVAAPVQQCRDPVVVADYDPLDTAYPPGRGNNTQPAGGADKRQRRIQPRG